MLPSALFDALRDETGVEFEEKKHCAVVVSQDCDVVHGRYDVEPYVEIVRGVRRQGRPDGNLLFAKSARRLQLQIDTAEGDSLYEFSALERFRVGRQLLEQAAPDTFLRLSDRDRAQLTAWLVKRYRRAAFPDAFVERLRPHRSALREVLKDWGDLVTGVFVLLHQKDELPEGTPYTLTVSATVLADRYENEAQRLQDEFQPELEDALRAVPGLIVEAVVVVSEADFSLDDVRHTAQLDLDDLSLRGDEPTVPHL